MISTMHGRTPFISGLLISMLFLFSFIYFIILATRITCEIKVLTTSMQLTDGPNFFCAST
uniref:Chlorophyll a-b binding protein 13ic n=1 Tax=Rhizophora mucronata TaxID=61149 RepID=A0A2P2L079_RHIMU